jgi:hypothetical protein
MARVAWEPTEKQIDTIREMSTLGASDSKIAKALNIHRNTFSKYKNAQDENVQNVQPIKKALEEGSEERRVSVLEEVEDAMRKTALGYFIEEEETFYKCVQIEDGEGNVIKEYDTPERKVKRRKFVNPNATLQMFLGVNLSEGKYQSINKVEVKQENNNADVYKVEFQDENLNGTTPSL